MAATTMGRTVASVVERVRKGFSPKLLGFSFVIPLFEVFRRISFDLPRLLARACAEEGYLASLTIGAIVSLLVQLALVKHQGKTAVRTRAIASVVLGVLACAGIAFACLKGPGWGQNGSITDFVVSISSLAFLGAAMATLFVGWAQAYAESCDPLLAAPGIAASIFLGNLLQPLITLDIAPLTLTALLFAGLFISSGLLTTCSLSPESTTVREAAARPAVNEFESNPCSGTDSEAETDLPSLFEAVWSALTAPSIGFVLCFFTWGVMATPPSTFARDHNWLVYFSGNLAALAVLAAYAWSLRSTPNYSSMRQKAFFLLPVFAIFIAYFSFIRMLDLNAGGTLKNILSFGFNMAAPGLAGLFLALAASCVREKGVPIESAVVPTALLGCIVYGIGAVSYAFLGNNAMYIQVVAATLYILGLSVISARRASLDDSRIERRCEELAARHGLSTREEEILKLVAADYSVERIAEQLVISTSTVRTHKKRIYGKLDVHKHEDLMRLVRQ